MLCGSCFSSKVKKSAEFSMFYEKLGAFLMSKIEFE